MFWKTQHTRRENSNAVFLMLLPQCIPHTCFLGYIFHYKLVTFNLIGWKVKLKWRKFSKYEQTSLWIRKTVEIDVYKEIESLPQRQIFKSLYLWNQMLKFQTIIFVRSNILSLKYQRFLTSGFKDIGVWIFEFVAKTQFLLNYIVGWIKYHAPIAFKKNILILNAILAGLFFVVLC